MKKSAIIARIVFLSMAFPGLTAAQVKEEAFINGDALPDAPELSARGKYKIGVRTVDVIHKDQTDILKSKDGDEAHYDRRLRLEIWYPALIPEGKTELIEYQETVGKEGDAKNPLVNYRFSGRALRDADPVSSDGPFPLIIVSHGYVGSRLLMTYLTENLASKGYVVIAIDHMESTYNDAAGFQSTLLNRSRDILFVLSQAAEMAGTGSRNFLSGIVDADNTGLIGYSMGGYGVLNAAGGGYSEMLVKMFGSMTGGSRAIEVLTADNPSYKAMHDGRIKAVVAFAPWGMERGVWDAGGLKGINVPVLFVAGDQDDISGYEKGTKTIYDLAVNSDRFLLTYINARHNVAPNPPPVETLKPGLPFDYYYHYAEPAWDQRRINNINQHFVTAFMGIHLKKMDYNKFLETGNASGLKNLPGFKPRTSVGLEVKHSLPQTN
jgi:predicted dienelactone hydrolase